MGWGGASVKLLALPSSRHWTGIPNTTMPTITRFLGFLLVLGAAAVAIVLAFAFLVKPEPRTYTIPIDPSVLSGARLLSPPPPPVAATPAVTDPAAPTEPQSATP